MLSIKILHLRIVYRVLCRLILKKIFSNNKEFTIHEHTLKDSQGDYQLDFGIIIGHFGFDSNKRQVCVTMIYERSG